MTRPSITLPLALASALAWSFAASAADEEGAHEKVKQGARDAGHAVAGAGEKVSAKIQGSEDDGELAPGMHTNTGRGYGSAGCGLGSIIFEPGSGFTQVFAATTNGLFGTQTFGITSGTSNCAKSGRGRDAARAFVETNRTALAKDIARGSGETITSLTRLGGCADATRVGAGLQRRFSAIFPSARESDREVSFAVIRELRADASLECKALT
jgi:Protein of unknown function (DUF3015)